MTDAKEFQESTTVQLDWTVRGLKQLFESSKGETKSKATKSVKFGGGKWQILFYPNSGTEGGQFVSLYLSCEPTSEEKDSAVDGRWVRAGMYKFSFELRNLSKTIVFSQKEAVDHSFSWKTANWGWAQFARRDTIYYQPNTVRNSDAFLIICTVSSLPAQPIASPRVSQRLVPRELLDVVGSLLDDPAYSDVEFILPRRRASGFINRRILAAKSVLSRAEYFRSMFGSGLAEASSQGIGLSSSQSDSASLCDSDIASHAQFGHHFEDSDDEEEEKLTRTKDIDEDESISPGRADSYCHVKTDSKRDETTDDSTDKSELAAETNAITIETPSLSAIDDEEILATSAAENSGPAPEGRRVPLKLTHPSSPRRSNKDYVVDDVHDKSNSSDFDRSSGSLSELWNKNHGVVVRDVAYITYRAVLYYLYTDSIIFAPLSSTFLMPQSASGSAAQTYPVRSQGEGQNVITAFNNRLGIPKDSSSAGPTTRIAWIKQWERQNPRKPTPCSAKAVYRVADKLGLTELKERAFQHIVKSLTIHNVPFEMFSSFSSTFEDVRKVELSFFLEHWNEIRASQSMQTVWQQIRAGRHPGFEEVWPLIAGNLEFRPRTPDATGGDNGQGNAKASV